MRFIPAEPDIATVFRRIEEKDIDLQPDFQRGEVWPITKQQRLIDTLLRGWVVPPVLLISTSGQPQQVLDGQQRLASIRNFINNQFLVDGSTEPKDGLIESLNGKSFENLPPETKRNFLRMPLRMYEIVDYNPEEPAEIFFRLNQPTGLTPAEKRNAFFGPVRDQIRNIVEEFEDLIKSGQSFLGFSNSRMAYDDVFSRVACTLENNTLHKKVTATSVNAMYRRREPLDEKTYEMLEDSMRVAAQVMRKAKGLRPDFSSRLNKATLFSWLIFFTRVKGNIKNKESLPIFFMDFETYRSKIYEKESNQNLFEEERSPLKQLMVAYSDRASARVADVTSVLIRDFALWFYWQNQYGTETTSNSSIKDITNRWQSKEMNESEILDFIEATGWGEELYA